MKKIVMAVLTAGVLISCAFATENKIVFTKELNATINSLVPTNNATAEDVNATQNGTKSFEQAFSNTELINGRQFLVISTFWLIPKDDIKITKDKNGNQTMKMSWGEIGFSYNQSGDYHESLEIKNGALNCLIGTSKDGFAQQANCKEK